jgi:glycosyltransferase involved in cell wall biosynthesis
VSTVLLILAAGSFLYTLCLTIDLMLGIRQMRVLAAVDAGDLHDPPLVSIIIPARNEERNLEPALRSVLAQDYPRFEVIVINDRSTDGTGAILQRISDEHADLRVREVVDLPAGWLGKNHAAFLGSREAGGELLLFTDADVLMTPPTLRRAVACLTNSKLDHLTVGPEVDMPGVFLHMFVAAFSVFFLVLMRPWKAADPRSRHFVGVGAFNLVRREAYEAAGTHRAIAMRPDDDIKLGKLLKRRGLRQEMLLGRGSLCVEWYATIREVIVGLEKNTFAAMEYSVPAVAGTTLLQFICLIWPWLAVFITSGPTRWLNLAILALVFMLYTPISRSRGVRWWYALSMPLMTLLFIYIVWRSTILALRRGGLRWRDTHYSLAELRANKV